MKRLDTTVLSIAAALVAVIATVGTPARATEMVEKRGDFWYDAGGRPVAARHIDPPAGFPRAGTSWSGKSAAPRVGLPPRAAPPAPRGRPDQGRGLSRLRRGGPLGAARGARRHAGDARSGRARTPGRDLSRHRARPPLFPTPVLAAHLRLDLPAGKAHRRS